MQGCIKVLGGRCAPKGSHIKNQNAGSSNDRNKRKTSNTVARRQTSNGNVAKALSKGLAELSWLASKLVIDDISHHYSTLINRIVDLICSAQGINFIKK